MKDFLIGLLAFLAICSSALNVYMFIQLENNHESIDATQTSSDNGISMAENNVADNSFNSNLIGNWTDGINDRFCVKNDGIAYLVTYSSYDSDLEHNGERPVYSLDYGYLDGSNFVVTQIYTYNTVINGGDGIYRYSDEEVISNCLSNVSVHTYRIVLEGNTITGFGDTRREFVRE